MPWDDPPRLSDSMQGTTSFPITGGRQRGDGEEGDCQTLCCNYTDDGSTRMHRGYGNLVK